MRASNIPNLICVARIVLVIPIIRSLWQEQFLFSLLLIVIAAIGVYAVFLFISDYNTITEKIIFFQIEYLLPILILVSISWIPLIIRWNILLKQNGINVPIKKSIMIWLSGSALGITPGKIGELFKSQILKDKFNIPRTKTAPLFIVEKFLDLVGALIVTLFGIWFFPELGYLAIFGLFILLIIFKILTSKKLFNKTLLFFSRFKFLQKYLEKSWGDTTRAILISSLFFALIHFT